MNFRLSVGDKELPSKSVLLNDLFAILEPRVSAIGVETKPLKSGQMSIETACLIIATVTPIVQLVYEIARDWFKENDQTTNDTSPQILVVVIEVKSGENTRVASNPAEAAFIDEEIAREQLCAPCSHEIEIKIVR